jgi:hypothetical protein
LPPYFRQDAGLLQSIPDNNGKGSTTTRLDFQAIFRDNWRNSTGWTGGGTMPELPKNLTVEEFAFSNMLTINALVELLTEKGVLTQQEILEKIKNLRSDKEIKKPQHPKASTFFKLS